MYTVLNKNRKYNRNNLLKCQKYLKVRLLTLFQYQCIVKVTFYQKLQIADWSWTGSHPVAVG